MMKNVAVTAILLLHTRTIIPNNNAPSLVAHSFTTCPTLRRRHYLQSQPSSRLYSSNENKEAPITTKKQKAGSGGYSILRQPVTYDSSSDPTFEVPMSLNEEEENRRRNNVNALWFEERKSKPSSLEKENDSFPKATTNRKNSNTEKELAEQQHLDLNDRTMTTLDYPIILKALAKECETVPARTLVLRNAFPQKETEEEEARRLKRKKSKGKKKMSGGDADDDIETMGLTASSVTGVQCRYNAISEMKRLVSTNVYGHLPPPRKSQENYKNPKKGKQIKIGLPPILGTSFDLQSIFDLIDDGRVLEGPEILEIATTLEKMMEVVRWNNLLRTVGKDDDEEKFVEIPKLCKSIYIEPDLLHLLSNAFDNEGRLSATTFPAIGRLRAQIRSYKASIMTKLETIIASPSMKNKLALESGGPIFSEVNGGRIVIPVQDAYKNSGVGIMHDVSRSGKTVFVEPTEIVGPTNEMKQVEVELRQEEAKVWRQLTEEVIKHRDDIERSVSSIVQIDLVLARMRLGDILNGVIPVVKDEGVMSVREAKHPVLVLRELEDIVGNDIDLGDNGNQGLVLTGPNSGGKTVILKLMGLFAYMTRDGIPLPAAPACTSITVDEETGDEIMEEVVPRVDYFDPVLADIGDIQSVDGDLSTFSGHMLVCREVLANSKKNALVLMDELGSGTDPAQGVAIAQALLEALLERGTRVAITTHYMELKQLAASDDRFEVGGMQFVGGRPTYKLLPGTVGESYALAVAERLNLPQSVIQRANELLDSETRQMGDLIRDLEDQKALVDAQALELEQKKKDMARLEIEMQAQREKLEAKQLSARRDEARKFAAKLEEKENILEDILQRLKSDPSKKLLARSWDDIRFVRRDALNEAENVPSVMKRLQKSAAAAAKVELVPLSELREKPDLKVGDTLVICKKGAFRGKEGIINQLGSNKIQLSVSGVPVQMKMNEIALPASAVQGENGNNDGGKRQRNADGSPEMSKIARKAMAEAESMGETRINEGSSATSGGKEVDVGRLDRNTVDVRGCNLEEAKRKCQDKFSSVMMSKRPVIYILHGHGTSGVLKQKIRDWLKRDREWVKSYKAASREDGGDAFTRVELKKIKF